MEKTKVFKTMNRMIKNSDPIFIMGHKDLDLDAIGSALAIYEVCKQRKKNVHIVLNDVKHESGVKQVLHKVKDQVSFVTTKQIDTKLPKKSLLIIVDVNKPMIMQDENLYQRFQNRMIIDHHEKKEGSISATCEYIHPEASSTSEVVTEFLYYHNYSLTPDCATYLLAGITLDTNDFSIKTNAMTHYAAYYLIRSGASVKQVNILLKQDIEEYILRQKVITDVEILHKTIAFAKGSTRIIYKKEELAKIADTLLEFNHIETSYVIGKLSEKEIGISARSDGKVNVGEILTKLGGGGDKNDAACRIENKSIKEVETELKQILGEGSH